MARDLYEFEVLIEVQFETLKIERRKNEIPIPDPKTRPVQNWDLNRNAHSIKPWRKVERKIEVLKMRVL